jgi:hypothetical protein
VSKVVITCAFPGDAAALKGRFLQFCCTRLFSFSLSLVCCTYVVCFFPCIQVRQQQQQPPGSLPHHNVFSFFQVSGGDWTTGALGCMASPGGSPTLLVASGNTPEGLLQDLSSPPLQGWKKKVCFFFLETLVATS